MKKYIFFGALAIGAALLTLSFTNTTIHGEGKMITAAADVPSFNAVEIDIPMQVTIIVEDGVRPTAAFSTYENILGHIKTKVENNTLIIYCEPGYSLTLDRSDLTAQIKLPAINGLAIHGSSKAAINGNVRGDKFSVDITGSGSVIVSDLNVNNFSSEISGSGKVAVNGGNVAHSRYEISGSGHIMAFGLQTKEASASISGSGSSEVAASDKLSVHISGSGSLRYKGHPVVSKEISGSGSVRGMD